MTYKELEEKYPILYNDIKAAQDALNNYIDLLDMLDKKYSVEGYFWNCDPNDHIIRLEKDVTLEQENEWSANLSKQSKCVDREHHFQPVSDGIEWCSFCGTIRNKDKYYYPENPHFLESQKLTK